MTRACAVQFACLIVLAGSAAAVDRVSAGPLTTVRAGAGNGDGGIHITSSRTASPPWIVNDSLGYRWDIVGNGAVADGTNDAYDTGLQLRVNGSGFAGSGAARLSKDGAEVEIGPWTCAGLIISRRVFINAKDGYCRWIDIFENNGATDSTVAVRYHFNMGATTRRTHTTSGGLQLTGKDWGIVTAGASPSSSRPAVVHVFATPTSKFKPTVEFSSGDDNLSYNASITVPAGKAAALCFFEAQRRPFESGVKFLKQFSPVRELSLVPAPLRRILLNMRGASLLLGDIELKRGDKFDLVTLRNGDEVRGRIITARYALRTGFGDLAVPADEVIGLLGGSAEKDLVKLVLAGGQVVAGELTGGPLKIRLPGGTELKVSPKAMRHAAYRISQEKPSEIRVTSSLVQLRRGEQLAFEDDQMSFAFHTSHGQVKLAAADLRRLEMDTPAGGLHRAVFRNGSSLAGLVAAERFRLNLRLGASLAIPRWQVKRILLATNEVAPKDLAKLTFRNADVLYGRFTDKTWAVESKFGTVEVDPADVARGEFSADSLGQVRLTLRNDTKIGGKLAGAYVGFKIEPGPALKIFVGKVRSLTGGKLPEEPDAATQPG